MNLRYKIASRIAGKAALSKDDFGDWQGFMAAFGQSLDKGQIAWDDWDAQRKMYRGTTYACIRKIAPGVAAAPLHLYIPDTKGSIKKSLIPVDDKVKTFLSGLSFCKATMEAADELEEVTDHPAIDIFNNANGVMSRSQLFDMTMVNMALHGNAYWHLIPNQTDSFPAQINFLSPTITKPITKGGITTGYKVREKLGKWTKLTLEEVAHFFYSNPFDVSQGYSPVSAGSQWITGEVAISSVQNNTMNNGGIPPFVVRVKRMGDQKFGDFKKAFEDLYVSLSGQRKKVGFTQGDWEIEQIAQTLEEMGYIEGARMLREFIAGIFGIPISKLTTESSNRATQGVADTEFQRDTLLPNLTLLAEEMTQSLIPRFPKLVDSGAFYMFDDPVKADDRLKIMARRVNRTTGVTTPNEERTEDGLEPHPSPEADSLAPVRATQPESPESLARDAIDQAVVKAVDNMRNGICDEH